MENLRYKKPPPNPARALFAKPYLLRSLFLLIEPVKQIVMLSLFTVVLFGVFTVELATS